jgi:hypothetical protein
MTEAQLKTGLCAKLKAAYPAAFFFRTGAGAFAMAGLPDIIGIVFGRFVGIEAKRPGKYSTPLKGCTPAQLHVRDLIFRAGGIWLATDDIDDCLVRLKKALYSCGASVNDEEKTPIGSL